MLKSDKEITNGIFVFFILFFIASIPTSKAVMNFISFFALAFMFYFYLNSNDCEYKKKIITPLFLIYVSFSLISLFYHDDINDFVFFLQKNSFLIIIPFFAIFLVNNKNLDSALFVFVLFCVLASIKSVYEAFLNENDAINRFTGFLDYSRHLNALLLGFCISLMYVFKRKKHIVFFSFSIIIIMLSVFLSGTRGAWLAFSVSLIFFCIRYSKRLIIYSFLFFSAAVIIMMVLRFDLLMATTERFSSIFNTNTDGSNLQRLSMWQGGVDYLKYVYEFQLEKFIFGSGMYSASSDYYTYLDSLPSVISENYKYNGRYIGGTDFHSAILDVTIKSGIIYSLLILFSMASVFYMSLFGKLKDVAVSPIITTYLVGLFVMSPFYSLYQDYSSFTIAFVIAIFISRFVKAGCENEG